MLRVTKYANVYRFNAGPSRSQRASSNNASQPHQVSAKACAPPRRPPPRRSPTPMTYRPPSAPPSYTTHTIDLAFRYMGNECPVPAHLHRYINQLLLAVNPGVEAIVSSQCVQHDSVAAITPANSLLVTSLHASPGALGGSIKGPPFANDAPPPSGVVLNTTVPVYCTSSFRTQVRQVFASIQISIPTATAATGSISAARRPPSPKRASSHSPPTKKAGSNTQSPGPATTTAATQLTQQQGSPSNRSQTQARSAGPSVVKVLKSGPALQAILDSLMSQCLVLATAAAGPYVSSGTDTTTGLALGPCTVPLQLPVRQMAACPPTRPAPSPPRYALWLVAATT